VSGPGKSLVVRVGDHFAVKYGKHIHLQEGENMLFVQQHASNVPIPTVYALFHDEGSDMNFIVLEHIAGIKLSIVWKDLSASDKTAIATQLRKNMSELRNIPAPGYYGGIWRQPTRDILLRDPEDMSRTHPDATISGPQETEEQWADAMWRCLGTSDDAPVQQRMLRLRRRHYRAAFRGHKPVFTHADITPENMILREDAETKVKTVMIIDWERSGWHPSCWEYCIAMNNLDYEDDWGEWVPEFLDEYRILRNFPGFLCSVLGSCFATDASMARNTGNEMKQAWAGFTGGRWHGGAKQKRIQHNVLFPTTTPTQLPLHRLA
jgi:hypothetical protein